MPIEARRRMALHHHASATWGEKVADTLLKLITPAGHELATKADLERLSEQLDRSEARVGQRLAELGERFERRIADAVTAQTRTLVLSQLGAIVAIAALAFGLR